MINMGEGWFEKRNQLLRPAKQNIKITIKRVANEDDNLIFCFLSFHFLFCHKNKRIPRPSLSVSYIFFSHFYSNSASRDPTFELCFSIWTKYDSESNLHTSCISKFYFRSRIPRYCFWSISTPETKSPKTLTNDSVW